MTNSERLIKISTDELEKKYDSITPELRNRLGWELNAVLSHGFEDMFLEAWDKIQDKLDAFGVVKGAVGCTLISYLLGITNVDPIKNNLSPYFFFSFDGNRCLPIEKDTFCKDEKNLKDLEDFVDRMNPKNDEQMATAIGYFLGEGVWESAQKIMEQNRAEPLGIPSCREEIFDFLVTKGIDEKDAYEIAELVRKGKVAYALRSNSDWAEDLKKSWGTYKNKCLEHRVSEWYLEHLENVEYMISKAYALELMLIIQKESNDEKNN